MSMFDKAKQEAENLEQQHPDQVKEGEQKLTQEADQMTGGRFDSQVNEGMQAAEKQMGMPGGHGQGQGQGQDPNQDPNQSQGQYQDPNQGQDPNQNQDPNQGQDSSQY